MFGVDDIAIAAASEIATEAATEVTEEIATETVTEVASDATSELADEALPSMVETAEATPESLTNPSEVAENKYFETNIIGDNISESSEMKIPDGSIEYLPDVQEDSPRTIKTINDGLAGQCHPDTGVPYIEKEVVTDTGEEVKGVFPQFESKFDTMLPTEMQQASDRTQFAECNRQLNEKIDADPEFRSQFTEDQLADIDDGYTPEGYTWHHNEEIGKMQLVDSDIHGQTRHTGGRNIWGGGTENRY